jgi:hypothetical protein
MAAEIRGWLFYVAIVVVIMMIGWDEPLRYRFMSRASIAEEEAALFPTPAPRVVQEPPPWQPVGSRLGSGRLAPTPQPRR